MKLTTAVVLSCLSAFLLLPSTCLSQQDIDTPSTNVEVDLIELDASTRESIIKSIADKRKEIEKKAVGRINIENITVENAEKWKDISNAMVEAINSLCKGLNVEINEFVKTPVGMLTVFVLLWKIIGASALIYAKNVAIWGMLTTILIISFRYFHMSKKVKIITENLATNKKIKTYEFIKRHEWEKIRDGNPAEIVSAVVHVMIFIITSIALL